MVGKSDITGLIRRNGLENSVVCLHSSLKAFGRVRNGACDVIDAFLDSGCTLVCPAFFYDSAAFPEREYKRNAMDFASLKANPALLSFPGVAYRELPSQIDRSMGIIPRTLLSYPQSLRTRNPMNSFCVCGPLADALVRGEAESVRGGVYPAYPVYRNIFRSSAMRAFIVLAGTDFTSCTPIHFAEEATGKRHFRRWAVYFSETVEVELGSCSEGFENLRPFLRGLERTDTAGNALARIYPFREFVARTADVIRSNPELTVCAERCARCVDMSRGGFLE